MAVDGTPVPERSARAAARSYPTNIPQTLKPPHALKAYNDRLLADEASGYVPEDKRAMALFDLVDGANAFSLQPKISTLEELVSLVNDGTPDPRCRFAFIYTAGSRGRLMCSLDQLVHTLSHHQVMPAFLDFTLRFGKKGKPATSNWFRMDDLLSTQSLQHKKPKLNRSGSKAQHCFNLMAFEYAKKEDTRQAPTSTEQKQSVDESWFLRHTTVYHSFDPIMGTSMWIVVKGDKAMRERLANSLHPRQGQDEQTTDDQFMASLKTHLQILEWCTENWDQYIEHVEERSRKYSTAASHAPVTELANATPVTSKTVRALDAQIPHPQMSAPMRVLTNISLLSRRTTAPAPPVLDATDHVEPSGEGEDEKGHVGNKRVEFENTFNFEGQQGIHRLTAELETASLVIDENLKILALLKRRYTALVETKETFRPYTNEVSDFALQVGLLEGDLRTHQSRIKMLSHQLEKHEDMFTRALEYRNMLTGIKYSLAAQKSATIMEKYSEKMHVIATKTEQKTVSMHFITIMGFLFLPCTFVSAFLSSEVIDFSSPPDGAHLGDWTVRRPALELFLLMSFLLMALTVPIWFVVYYRIARRRQGPDEAI